jgi:hypothetical protein
MNKRYFKFIVFGLFFAITLVSLSIYIEPSRASTAEELGNQMQVAGNAGWGNVEVKSNSFAQILETVISAFLSLLGIIFLVLIIYAGFGWMTAQGDEEKVTKAKDTLTRAIIGLIIIIAAYSITYFVFSVLPAAE